MFDGSVTVNNQSNHSLDISVYHNFCPSGQSSWHWSNIVTALIMDVDFGKLLTLFVSSSWSVCVLQKSPPWLCVCVCLAFKKWWTGGGSPSSTRVTSGAVYLPRSRRSRVPLQASCLGSGMFICLLATGWPALSQQHGESSAWQWFKQSPHESLVLKGSCCICIDGWWRWKEPQRHHVPVSLTL